jgi:large subunit ribosomal protein L9
VIGIVREVRTIARRLSKASENIEKDLNELQQTQHLAEELDGYALGVVARANEHELLYAALTPLKIAELLNAQGFKVAKTNIVTEPLKTVGEHVVKIKLKHGLEANITVVVTPEGAKQGTN